jgi:hypothetical protein
VYQSVCRLPGQFDTPESPDWGQYITVFGLVQEIVVGGCSHEAVFRWLIYLERNISGGANPPDNHQHGWGLFRRSRASSLTTYGAVSFRSGPPQSPCVLVLVQERPQLPDDFSTPAVNHQT